MTMMTIYFLIKQFLYTCNDGDDGRDGRCM
jgi:hypothetical protein